MQQAHPEFIGRTCDECTKWVYRDDGTKATDNTGNPYPLRGKPPCLTCPKCLHSRHKSPQVGRLCDLSERNELTLQRYYEHLVTPGEVDDITIKNFGIIRQVLDDYQRMLTRHMLTATSITK
jgi:hypothetical protein